MTKDALAAQIKTLLGKRALFNHPASQLTTWKVGGAVWCVAMVNDLQELLALHPVLRANKVPYMPLGMGSNLLFADSGYDGVLITLQAEMAGFEVRKNTLVAGGGARLSQLLTNAPRLGLSGLEWAAGIPATIGGAIAMNAGSMGNDMANLLDSVSLLLADGKLLELSREHLPKAAYRDGGLPKGSIVLQATIKMLPARPEDIEASIKANLASKRELFPLELPNAGSVFKNPPGDFAGRLIEAAGMKGCRLGNAQISSKHANFIVNLGAANADDILGLIQLTQNKVKEMFAVELQTEIVVAQDGLG